MRKTTCFYFSCAAFTALGTLPLTTRADSLAPLVVTPTRTPQSQADTDASITVLNRQDIQNSGTQSLDELLVGVPGLGLSNSGGYGKQTSLFMRGTGSDQNLVIIDGVRVNTASEGAALIQNIPLDQIQRVEIVRGPRSSLYGSEALGGVIQIFTRKTDKPFTASSSVSAGNDGATRYNQFLGGNSNGTRWNLDLSGFNTAGQDATQGGELDKDGFNNRAITAGVEGALGDRWSVGANLYRSQGNTQFDSPNFIGPNANTDYVQQTLSAHAEATVSDRMTVKAQLSQAQDRLKDYSGGTPVDNAVGIRNTLSLNTHYLISAKQTLVAGLERSEDHDRQSKTAYTPAYEDSRYNDAAYFESLGSEWGFQHQASLRYDHNQQFGSKATGSMLVGYPINDLLSPYVSYGTAFSAPTFTQLYYPGDSNPDLKPVEGRTWELGVKGHAKRWHYSLNLYRSRIKDLIIYPPPNYIPENVDRSHIRGAEGSVGGEWAGWDLSLSAGYTRAVDAQTGELLIRRPRWNGRAAVQKRYHDFTFHADLRVQGASWDNAPSGRVRLGGFALTDMSVTWQARPKLQLEARVDNLFDRNAVTVYGYNGRSRLVLATVRYQYQ